MLDLTLNCKKKVIRDLFSYIFLLSMNKSFIVIIFIG